jgi:outer membrane protein TolC
MPSLRPLTVMLAALLSGCASLSPRPDHEQLNRLLDARGAPTLTRAPIHAEDRAPMDIRKRLAAPLGREQAVEIALLRSPQMRALYADLGLARAEVIEAVEIANPGIAIGRRHLSPGEGYTQTVSVSLPFVDALLLPLRSRWAKQQYERHSLDVAQAVIDLTIDVESAWYRAVAAQQVADMRAAIADGADASSELAQRFFDAGNISELQLAREQAVATQARIDAAHARAEALGERLAFGTLLGLGAADGDWSLADRLPMPVASEDDAEALVRLAESSNLELQAARLQEAQLRSALRTTRATRWFGGVEAEVEREKEADGAHQTGPTLSLELPLFNQGQSTLGRAEALLAEAQARRQRAELTVTTAVRSGAQALAEHRRIVALYRDALIPQRAHIVARSQQAQNFMLLGVFELIEAKLEEYDAYQRYLEAIRDYWLARAELMAAVGQRLPSDAAPAQPTPSVQDILSPKAAAPIDHSQHGGMDHSQHGGMDHSQHGGMDHSQHGGMDHSPHGQGAKEKPAKPENAEDDPPHHLHHDGAKGDTP